MCENRAETHCAPYTDSDKPTGSPSATTLLRVVRDPGTPRMNAQDKFASLPGALSEPATPLAFLTKLGLLSTPPGLVHSRTVELCASDGVRAKTTRSKLLRNTFFRVPKKSSRRSGPAAMLHGVCPANPLGLFARWAFAGGWLLVEKGGPEAPPLPLSCGNDSSMRCRASRKQMLMWCRLLLRNGSSRSTHTAGPAHRGVRRRVM